MLNQKGFTIKELLMVFVVIAILCLAAIPPFFALQQSRRRTEMEKTATELRLSLEEIKKKGATLPQILDDNPDQSSCLNCFSALLIEGLNNPLWYKFAPTVYLYSTNGNHDAPTDYQEPGDFKIEYDATKGDFSVTEILPAPAQ